MPEPRIPNRLLAPTAYELFEAMTRAVKNALVKLGMFPHYADDCAQLRAVLARVEEHRAVLTAALTPISLQPPVEKKKTRAS